MQNKFFFGGNKTVESVEREIPKDSCTTDGFFKHCKDSEDFQRSFSKGKSFEFSEWDESISYTNDLYKQDFVTYQGKLYACMLSNTNENPRTSECWKLAVDKMPVHVFVPEVDYLGNLFWKEVILYENSDGSYDVPPTSNVRGLSTFLGDGFPNVDIANVGDSYIDYTMGTIYKCQSRDPFTWVVTGELFSGRYFQWINI